MLDRPRAFPPSLHPLSVIDGIAASAQRTPARPAVIDGKGSMTYAALAAAVDAQVAAVAEAGARARSSAGPADIDTLVAMLAAARIGAALDLTTGRVVPADAPGRSEDAPFAIVDDGAGRPLALSHRTVILRALNAAVMHAAFSRDTVSGTPLSLATAAGIVAAIAPLWLGGTVRFATPDRIVEHITRGEINQAWFDAAPVATPESGSAPPNFRLAILTARPSPEAWTRWTAWLGSDRVVVEAIDPHLGALHRLRGPDLAAEPHIGVMFDTASRAASGLATAPGAPAWRGVQMGKLA